MLALDEIGGAYVRRTFTRGTEHLRMGMKLTADEVLSFGENNRRALVDAGYIDVWPKSPVESVGSRHIVHLGGGRFDVIEGRKLNDEPLTKDGAEELATRPD